MQLWDTLLVLMERSECMRNGGGSGKWNNGGSAHRLIDEMGVKRESKKELKV